MESRMYFFVMYNLSGIQKGIQAGHAAIEYQLEHGKTKQYKEWANNHKTFIVLDGGGSDDMKQRVMELLELKVNHSFFIEPDLNNSVSAIAFIVPELIYNRKVDEYYIDNPELQSPEEKYTMYLKSFRLASN